MSNDETMDEKLMDKISQTECCGYKMSRKVLHSTYIAIITAYSVYTAAIFFLFLLDQDDIKFSQVVPSSRCVTYLLGAEQYSDSDTILGYRYVKGQQQIMTCTYLSNLSFPLITNGATQINPWVWNVKDTCGTPQNNNCDFLDNVSNFDNLNVSYSYTYSIWAVIISNMKLPKNQDRTSFLSQGNNLFWQYNLEIINNVVNFCEICNGITIPSVIGGNVKFARNDLPICEEPNIYAYTKGNNDIAVFYEVMLALVGLKHLISIIFAFTLIFLVICCKWWDFNLCCIWNIGDLYDMACEGFGGIFIVIYIISSEYCGCGGWNDFEEQFYPTGQHEKLPEPGRSVGFLKLVVGCAELAFPIIAVGGCWGDAGKYPQLVISAVMSIIKISLNTYTFFCKKKEGEKEENETNYQQIRDTQALDQPLNRVVNQQYAPPPQQPIAISLIIPEHQAPHQNHHRNHQHHQNTMNIQLSQPQIGDGFRETISISNVGGRETITITETAEN